MEPLQAIILGVVQGATEFLPISSSGHLLLLPSLLGWSEPDLNVIAIAHLGTLLAVLAYFRTDLFDIARSMLKGLAIGKMMAEADARLGWLIIAASVPAAVIGLLVAEWLDRLLGTPDIAAALLLVTALILWLGEKRLVGSRPLERLTLANVLVIGLAQSLALLPGISRSGVTIAAGLGQGLDRESAARFSFLLGIPAIAGAGALSLVDLLQTPGAMADAGTLTITLVAAAVIGFVSIHFMLEWLRRKSVLLFAGYCAIFGLLFLLNSWLRQG